MASLDRFLADYDMAMIRALAQSRGIALATNRQTEAAGELAAALIDPVSVRTALARLSSQARSALDSLVAAGGQMRAPQFDRRYGTVRPIGPGRLERECPWQDPINAAEELWYSGLIFRGFSQTEAGSGEFIFVPQELVPLLPTTGTASPVYLVDTIPAPSLQNASDSTLVDELFTYLVYVQSHDVRSYADGRLSQRDQAALARQLREVDARRFALVQHLAARMGLTLHQDEYLRLAPAPTKSWLSATLAQQLTSLQQAWHDDPTWNDLCLVPTLTCDDEMPWRNNPVATRRAVLALLARCPLDGWWYVSSFVAGVKEQDPDFQRPDGDYANWYIRDAASGEYHSGFESWENVEGALIADLLEGTLRWLGFVECATAEKGIACRLTAAGARFLGLVPEQPPDQHYLPLVIHPDLRVDAPTPTNLYTRFQLERFADSLTARPRRAVGPVRRSYRITVNSLGRALTRGIRVEQVLAFLQQASGSPVPANVADQLHLWTGRFGQVQLNEVVLLQVESEQALKELLTLPETRSLVDEILSPTRALVRKDHLPRLRKELAILGYLPPLEPSGDVAEHG